MSKRLYRSVGDRRIGGVAAGTAEYFDIDPSIARVLWVLLAIFTGGAFLIVVPGHVGGGARGAMGPEHDHGHGDGSGGGRLRAEARHRSRRRLVRPEHRYRRLPGHPSSVSSSGPSGRVILGAILILIGGWALAREFIPGFNWGLLWPIGLVAIGVIILLAAVRRAS